MRIALVGPAPPLRGGIAQHTAGMAEALARIGCDVFVFSYSRQYPGVFFPGSSQRDGGASVGEEVLDVLAPSSWRRTADRIAALDVDRVVAQWWHPVAAPALSAVFSRVRGPVRTLICHNAGPHEWFPAAASALRHVASRSDEIVCHSEHVARAVRTRGVSTASRIVPLPLLPRGIETEAGPAAEDSDDEERRRVLFCGHIRSYKGMEYLLDSWSRRDRGTPAILSIVGEDYRRGVVRRLRGREASDGGEIERQCGYASDSDLLRAVAAADALVLPYIRASQSGWMPIAAALGTSVVASDVGGLREQAAPGQDVRWVSPGNPGELTRALNEVIRRRRRSAAVRREALAGYARARTASWRRFCEVLGIG